MPLILFIASCQGPNNDLVNAEVHFDPPPCSIQDLFACIEKDVLNVERSESPPDRVYPSTRDGRFRPNGRPPRQDTVEHRDVLAGYIFQEHTESWKALRSVTQLRPHTQLFVVVALSHSGSVGSWDPPVKGKAIPEPCCVIRAGANTHLTQSRDADGGLGRTMHSSPSETRRGRSWSLPSTHATRPLRSPVRTRRQHLTHPVPPTTAVATPVARGTSHPHWEEHVSPHRALQRPPTRCARTIDDTVTLDEKVLVVFEEMDLNNDRFIQFEEWEKCLAVLGIHLPPPTVTELYDKATHQSPPNRSGERRRPMNFSDARGLFEQYPSLCDALYLRIRDYWESFALHEELREITDRIHRLGRRATIQSELLTSEHRREIREAQTAIIALDRELQARNDAERELESNVRELRYDVDRALQEKKIKQVDFESTCAREEQTQRAYHDTLQACTQLEQDIDRETSELRYVLDDLRRAKAVVSDIEQDVRNRQLQLETLQGDLDQERERERHRQGELCEAQHEMRRLQHHIAELQRKLSGTEERLQVAHMEWDVFKDETERIVRRREAHQQRVEEARAQTHVPDREEGATTQQIYALNQRRADVENRIRTHRLHMKQIENNERSIIEQEIRLRAQRDVLMEKELEHHSIAHSYFDSHRLP